MNKETSKIEGNQNQSVANALQVGDTDGSTFQFIDNRPEAIAQRKLQQMAAGHSAIQKKENNTGLPDNLKSGIENISGHSMNDVKVHYNSGKPAQLQAHAYAQGTDIHIATGQEKHLPHEAWHIVQQKQGRVKPTLQLKGQISINDDTGLEKEADVMGLKAQNLSYASQVDKTNITQTKAIQPLIQRWASPAEDDQANRFRDNLDGIEASATRQRDRARDLSTNVPALLRGSMSALAATRITAYNTANALRLTVNAAQGGVTQAVTTIAALRALVILHAGQLANLKQTIDTFSDDYDNLAGRINAQVDRYGTIDQILALPNGAAKQGAWVRLATAVENMNLAQADIELNTFEANITADAFSEAEVAASRQAPFLNRPAVVQFLTTLFATGQLSLNTWSKSYPTAYDLRTGEFGAEWYLKCGGQRWVGQKWVFHAHCESIRDDHGNFIGFQFKNILGTNHLKMTAERMAAGVQLDLPLTRATLDQMAAPYQEEYMKRYRDDSTFRQTLKHGR